MKKQVLVILAIRPWILWVSSIIYIIIISKILNTVHCDYDTHDPRTLWEQMNTPREDYIREDPAGLADILYKANGETYVIIRGTGQQIKVIDDNHLHPMYWQQYIQDAELGILYDESDTGDEESTDDSTSSSGSTNAMESAGNDFSTEMSSTETMSEPKPIPENSDITFLEKLKNLSMHEQAPAISTRLCNKIAERILLEDGVSIPQLKIMIGDVVLNDITRELWDVSRTTQEMMDPQSLPNLIISYNVYKIRELGMEDETIIMIHINTHINIVNVTSVLQKDPEAMLNNKSLYNMYYKRLQTTPQ